MRTRKKEKQLQEEHEEMFRALCIMSGLPKRAEQILFSRYMKRMTLSEIAYLSEISQERVNQILAKTREKILKGAGLDKEPIEDEYTRMADHVASIINNMDDL